ISAGASDVVTLRGLTLNGLGGSIGIDFVSGGALYVEQDTIKNFSYGVYAVTSSSSAVVRIEDTTVTRSFDGVFAGVNGGSGTVKMSIVDSRFEDGDVGVYGWRQSEVAVQNSVATGDTTVGFYAEQGDIDLDGCVVS